MQSTDMGKILLFNVSAEKKAQIDTVCKGIGISTAAVAKEQYADPIGAILGIKGIEKSKTAYRGREFDRDMMVFHGVDSQTLDKFLELCGSEGIQPVDLKAVVTFHNIFWSAKKLYNELLKEHENFHPKEKQ